jgi:hypothetical protein
LGLIQFEPINEGEIYKKKSLTNNAKLSFFYRT